MNILVTGANGQLGNEMRCIAATSLNNYILTSFAAIARFSTALLFNKSAIS